MIAILLGSVLLAAVTNVFMSNSATRSNLERSYQLNDNGLHGLQTLAEDLRNAGYYADFDPGLLDTPAAVPNACAATLADWRTALPIAVQGQDKVTTAPTCLTDVRTGTDIVTVRRVGTCAIGSPNCDPPGTGAAFLQSSRCNRPNQLSSSTHADHYRFDTDRTKLDRLNRDCTTPAPDFQYRTHHYFIANNDKPGDGIPTLKRAELNNGQFVIVPIAQGIENLQIEYGIDSGHLAGGAPTGMPGAYLADPGTYSGCAGKVCAGYWRNTVAARIHLLARSRGPILNYVDSKSYFLGLNANGSDNTIAAANDNFRRQIFSTTVRLNNVAGRNLP